MEQLKVADEAWLATALLHREHPEREDFKLSEIRQRANKEFRDPRPGVWYHIVSHCVASIRPSPASHRMLHATDRGRRRLFRRGDPCHPGRRSGKLYPNRSDLPEEYRSLVDWYENEYSRGGTNLQPSSSPAMLMAFVGAIASYDLGKMAEAIRTGCERVDENAW